MIVPIPYFKLYVFAIPGSSYSGAWQPVTNWVDAPTMVRLRAPFRASGKFTGFYLFADGVYIWQQDPPSQWA
jgi:hypothetical protein